MRQEAFRALWQGVCAFAELPSPSLTRTVLPSRMNRKKKGHLKKTTRTADFARKERHTEPLGRSRFLQTAGESLGGFHQSRAAWRRQCDSAVQDAFVFLVALECERHKLAILVSS